MGPSLTQQTPRRQALLVAAIFTAIAAFMVMQLPSHISRTVSLQADRLDGTPPDAFEDYIAYYAAGRLVLEGDGGSLYDVERIREEQTQAAGRPVGETGVLPYFNPPFVAVFFAPLSVLSLEAFGLALLVLNLALAGGGLLLLDRYLGLGSLPARGFVALAFVTLTSVAWVLDQGQVSMVLFYGWLGFAWFERQGRPYHAGMSLALVLVKPQMLVLVLALLLVKRRKQEIAGLALPAVLLGLVSIAAAGPGVIVDYPRFLLDSTGWHGDGVHTRIMYGWNSFLVWVTGTQTAAHVPLLVLDLVTAAVVAIAARRLSWSSEGVAKVCSLVLAASILVNPHLYLQELVLAPVALAFAFAARPAGARSLPAWGALLTAFWVVDLLARIPGPIPGPVLFQMAASLFIVGMVTSILRGRQDVAVPQASLAAA